MDEESKISNPTLESQIYESKEAKICENNKPTDDNLTVTSFINEQSASSSTGISTEKDDIIEDVELTDSINTVQQSALVNENIVTNEVDKLNDSDANENELSYGVSLKIPGVSDPIYFKVHGNQQTIELKQIVLDLYEPTMRTCFSLKMDKVEKIDEAVQVKNIPGIHDDAVFRLEDEPYNHREVLFHINRLRELLNFDLNYNAFNGTKNCSLSAFTKICDSFEGYNQPDNIEINRLPYSFQVTDHLENLLSPCIDTDQINQSGNILQFKVSSFNPPSGQRKMCGDIIYLDIITYENKYYCVTCSRSGFFVNKSTQDDFDFFPSSENLKAYTLVLLLSKISSSFKDYYSRRINKLKTKSPYEIEATPVQTYTWFAPDFKTKKDDFEAFETGFGVDFISSISSASGQLRDWNEELQEIRELPKSERIDQLLRDRALFKFYSELVNEVKNTASLILQGYVLPLNPKESTKYHMYFWNNIFYSYSVDAKNVFQKYGGDIATEKLARLEVSGYEKFNQFDPDNLYSVVSIVVDHFGKRLVAQTFVPGILRKSLEDGVIHGSIDFGKTIKRDEEFCKRASPFFDELKIRTSLYLNNQDKDGSIVELPSSLEVKGALGSDGRYYCLDMYRIMPPDFLFIEENDQSVKSIDSNIEFASDIAFRLSDGYQFPFNRFSNKMTMFRDKLFDHFLTTEYVKFLTIYKKEFDILKNESDKHLKEKSEKLDESINNSKNNELEIYKQENKTNKNFENDENKDIKNLENNENSLNTEVSLNNNSDGITEMERSAIMKACKLSYSSCPDNFDIRINPDSMLTHLKRPDNENEFILMDKFNSYRIGSFLVNTVIPNLTNRLILEFIIDGCSITDFLHDNGVNMRYLGYFASLIKKDHMLSHIYNVCVSEILIRSVKQHYRNMLKTVNLANSASFISHYLNCFLGSNLSPELDSHYENVTISKRMKKKLKGANIGNENFDSNGNNIGSWTKLTPQNLWKTVKSIAIQKFNINIECKSAQEFSQIYDIGPLQLLRRFSIVNGIQIKCKKFDFDKTKQTTFCVEDILNVFPVIKYPKHIPSYGLYLLNKAKELIQLNHQNYHEIIGLLELCCEYFLNIYGILHPIIAECYALIADIYNSLYKLDLSNEYYSKSLVIYERIYSIDHYLVAKIYYRMGINLFYQNQNIRSLIMLARARDIIFTCYGNNYFELSTIYTIIAFIMAKCKKDRESLYAHKLSLDISLKYDINKETLNLGMTYFILARQQVACSLLKEALSSARDSLNILKIKLGDKHQTTIEISEFLDKVVKLAVMKEKCLRDSSSTPYDKLKEELNNLMNNTPALPYSFTSFTNKIKDDDSLLQFSPTKPIETEIPLD